MRFGREQLWLLKFKERWLLIGCVFWDWQQAQGGEGSMIAWLYTDPPLAAKDLIHHTSAGYIHIAERFIEALDDAKENYK